MTRKDYEAIAAALRAAFAHVEADPDWAQEDPEWWKRVVVGRLCAVFGEDNAAFRSGRFWDAVFAERGI